MGDVTSLAAARRAARPAQPRPAQAVRSLAAIRRMMPTLAVAIAMQDVAALKGLAGLGGPLPGGLCYLTVAEMGTALPKALESAA
jgi:hypothetical protein